MSGAVEPSVPIRNALETLRPPAGKEQLPPLPGTAGLFAATVVQLTGWMRPGLSSGVSTLRVAAVAIKILNAASGVAYRKFGTILTSLVAPNPAPRSYPRMNASALASGTAPSQPKMDLMARTRFYVAIPVVGIYGVVKATLILLNHWLTSNQGRER